MLFLVGALKPLVKYRIMASLYFCILSANYTKFVINIMHAMFSNCPCDSIYSKECWLHIVISLFFYNVRALVNLYRGEFVLK